MALVALLSAIAILLSIAMVALAAWRLSRRAAPLLGPDVAPPVTIIRPVCGLEPFSVATLSSGFRLDYPAYELVFCVATRADPVVPLVERLMGAHPDVPARLLVGDDAVSENPKLNNCIKGWDAARHDWIVLADSNVEMPRDYIRRLLAAWRPNTGLVCSMPVGTQPSGFWAAVECAFLNTFQARWQYAAEALGEGYAQGKSMLWHRSMLDAHGGLRALSSEAAEDAAATKLVRRAGLRVHLVDRPFPQPIGAKTAAHVWKRQLRWSRLRLVTFPALYLGEFLTSPVVLACGLAAGAPALGFSPWLALPALALCYAAEIALARRMGWPLGRHAVAAFLVRDLMIPALWLASFVTRQVVWHGRPMDVRRGAAQLAAAGAEP
ncbi:ceramide glucosyltransferase [Enterovirga rhinocerotis]|nr:ceramide glucosyltransferase [Enterovirga rhinocerotis]